MNFEGFEGPHLAHGPLIAHPCFKACVFKSNPFRCDS